MVGREDRNKIIVFTGPDGSGRKSVAEAVGQTFGMDKIVSFVTRLPRPGEVNGQDYHFITHATYREMERQGEFLESVEIDGHLYGIRSLDIETKLSDHESLYLILNHEGAGILKKIYGDKVIRLFLYADRRTVEERERKLGLAEDVIAKHLSHYDGEMEYRGSCEHAFENYDLGQTTYEITNTLEAYLQRDLVDKD
ncbi:guanylate kinase [Cohnella cholangitidis]|uniref:Guanylate kinase n=1 Tax=Cohnella cholangitidis TaxID=2598458 RepID=A0A7G5C2B9_9BACL|nr:guanylate kinase [Cohnella cholangitidis]QMV43353.1 guanylate kinase [Cohnella cholangitidis]